jgi:hypothetical protein
MKYTEEQKEMINKLLDEFVEGLLESPEVFEVFLANFKKENGLLPKPKLEVGKWYKNEYHLQYIEYINNGIGYGYGFTFSKWDTNKIWAVDNGSQVEATELEVFEALKAEAKKRGFKKGVKYNCNGVHERTDNVICGGIVVSQGWKNNDSKWEIHCKNNGWIYLDGKWAEIVEDNKLQELEAKYKALGEEIEKLKGE